MSEQEKVVVNDRKSEIETEMADYLNDLRLSGQVEYYTYVGLHDTVEELMQEMYDLGKKDAQKSSIKG